jgi:site-specific DNA recombinase
VFQYGPAQRREEVLVDVEDVAAGHRTKMVWNQPATWVHSSGASHPPLVSPELFERARGRLMTSQGTPGRKKPRESE